jgi:hypothetical protein
MFLGLKGECEHECEMKIQELIIKSGTATVSSWPPVWASSYGPGDVFPHTEEGVLESVKRIRNPADPKEHLMLVKKVKGHEYVGALQWDEPPTIAAVEVMLKAHLGESIRAIGELEV